MVYSHNLIGRVVKRYVRFAQGLDTAFIFDVGQLILQTDELESSIIWAIAAFHLSCY